MRISPLCERTSSKFEGVSKTFLILIFGEITPKAAAKESSEKVALKFSGILFIVHKISIDKVVADNVCLTNKGFPIE